jgi:hypothetical protein
VHSEGKIGSTRRELDAWIKTLPQLQMIAMEATSHSFYGQYTLLQSELSMGLSRVKTTEINLTTSLDRAQNRGSLRALRV